MEHEIPPSLSHLLTSYSDWEFDDDLYLQYTDATLAIDIPGYKAGSKIPSLGVDFWEGKLYYDTITITFVPLTVAVNGVYDDNDSF